VPGCEDLWIKRDDLNASVCGGNKVRALEFLLGDVRPNDVVLTLGGEGSTHVLATAIHAARLGARTVAVRWRHEMNPVAGRVAGEARTRCAEIVTTHTVVGAFAHAYRLRLGRRLHYVPIGGSVPLGVVGHVNAAVELAGQIRAGAVPRPERVVVPLGSGGTAAGLALGFAIAGVETTVVGARVAPRLAANRTRVLRLARATARLIERTTGERVPGIDPARVVVAHEAYGGAYGRPLPAGDAAAAALSRARGLALDATYSAKAYATALADPPARGGKGPTLFWLTFDARVLSGSA
jgi:D-cysteine desulfhydrase